MMGFEPLLTMTFTHETLEKFEGREDYLGFGYLGGFTWRSTRTDEILLAAANEAGISLEDFFQFCNSKGGRKLDEYFEGEYDEKGDWFNYWPVQEDEEGVRWSIDDDEQKRGKDAPKIVKTNSVHESLHAKLVDFLPDYCKLLREEY